MGVSHGTTPVVSANIRSRRAASATPVRTLTRSTSDGLTRRQRGRLRPMGTWPGKRLLAWTFARGRSRRIAPRR
ncbi:unnamed protein product [[Actinomadura] parvosata subsp. kistnae]|nr:unnamed protein product [Actinomadura parvosata subsp. kistnae]